MELSSKKMQRVADRVHGTIYLTDLASRIVHTPQFSRLDDIRQLGACSFVYPSATHTRREHSLGVYHLARTAALHLQRLYPDLVDDDDVVCIEVAGLIHDLGHGPFSHLFEVYMNFGWSHEKMGLAQFDLLLRDNNIDLQRHFTGSLAENVAMIALLVTGLGEDEAWPESVRRSESKRFLTHIVHCRATGMDVDKLDYLARDALAVFGSNNVLNVARIVGAMRAAEDFSHIGFSSHVVHELVEVYQMRARLHERVYQHHTVVLVEGLLLDLMKALDRVPSRTPFHRAANDPVAFSALSDGHVLRLAYNTDPVLKGAPRRAFDELHGYRRMRRIPMSVILRTQPYCAVCHFATEIRDSYCSNCGESTISRGGILGEDGVFTTSECLITTERATAQLQRELIRDAPFRLHIVDVTCGNPTTTQDPHGYKWNDYELVKNIVFVNRDGMRIDAGYASFLIPRFRRCRRVYCYAFECADVAEITRALGAWGVQVGEIVE